MSIYLNTTGQSDIEELNKKLLEKRKANKELTVDNIDYMVCEFCNKKLDFKKQFEDRAAVKSEQVLAGLDKTLNGIIKTLLVANLFRILFEIQNAGLVTHLERNSFSIEFILVCTLYLLYLFFNFSGYMDIVIALS